jgi:RimJ/RimL family protein N-acetyltransferase
MFLSTPFQLQPNLVGETLTLRPLVAEDLEPLYGVARDPLIWEQHPQPERAERRGFEKFFQSCLASGGALVAVENRGGRVVGSSRFYEWNPDVPDIAIGYSFLSRDLWGTGANAQMKALMLAHAFRNGCPRCGSMWLRRTCARAAPWRRSEERSATRR